MTRKRPSLFTGDARFERLGRHEAPGLHGANFLRGGPFPLRCAVPQTNQIGLQFLQIVRLELAHLVLDREERHAGKIEKPVSVVKEAGS